MTYQRIKINNSGKQFLRNDSGVDDEDRILILYNNNEKDHIVNSNIWLADGTFKIAPTNFYQNYIIYIKICSNFFPIIYGILKNKTLDTYVEFLYELKRLTGTHGPNFCALDQEKSPIHAFNIIFPATKIYNCLLHFRQSMRKIQNENLVIKYKNTKIIKISGFI
ncbi:hypothetical protein DMUE_1673 [Dictyocoela muelleri]|nr:hypothetical protein DMUE_1673 [Dictyocoela muelleri]